MTRSLCNFYTFSSCRVVASSLGKTSSRAGSTQSLTRGSLGRHSLSSLHNRSLEKNGTSGDNFCTFSLRVGTSKGVENRVFRTETVSSRAFWVRSIVNGCHNCVTRRKLVKFGRFLNSFHFGRVSVGCEIFRGALARAT